MCGVMGYVGARDATPVLLDGLRRQEYRGYDSAGLAVLVDGKIDVRRCAGRMERLVEKLQSQPMGSGHVGIGHIRWATHGGPTDDNAHPHTDCSGEFVCVHNGIIENCTELRRALVEQGHVFTSETDSEVVPHLVESRYRGDLAAAVREVVAQLQGSFALIVMCLRERDRIVAVRKNSPLIVGIGEGETFVASDLPAVMPYTRRAYILEDGEMAVIDGSGRIEITDWQGGTIAKEVFHIDWDAARAEKGGFDHFMLKEIHEQPSVLRDTLSGRLEGDPLEVTLPDLSLDATAVAKVREVCFLGCGTAYHAGLVAALLTERLSRLPARAELASEFRYRDPQIDGRTLIVPVSQSGETADTLAALREAQKRGAHTLAVVNVVGSSLSREADDVLYTRAGPEIAVASTKAYTCQLAVGILLALRLASLRGTLDPATQAELTEALIKLPEQAERVLAETSPAEGIRSIAENIAASRHAFFIGRGFDYLVALEGQLKLKETSYIHAEAYPAGELKHGALALIEEDVPVVAVVTEPGLREKTLANVQEVRSRGARVFAVAREGDEAIGDLAENVMWVPQIHPYLMPILAVIPLQLLAYYTAVARGNDVDKPRNLAKSVTVE